MVGIHRHDGGDIGVEVQKGTVKFISFNHYPIAATQHVVGFKIAGNTSQKGRTIHPGTAQQVSSKRGSSRFAVRPSNGYGFHAPTDDAQYFCPFFNGCTILQKILVFRMTGWNCRSIHHQINTCRNFAQIFLIMYMHAFSFQRTGQFSGSAVVTVYFYPTLEEIAGDGAHADTADSDEIKLFNVLKVKHNVVLFH